MRPRFAHPPPRPVLLAKIRRDLGRRRARTFLTLLGIVVGVAGVVAVSAVSRQLAVAQARLDTAPDRPTLTVATAPIRDTAASALGRAIAADAVEARTALDTAFSDGGPWRNSLLIAFAADREGLSRPILLAGRWPGPGEIAFDRGVADLAAVSLGDLVAVRTAAGSPIVELRVVGLSRTPGALAAGILNRVTAYAAPAEVAALAGAPGANRILIRLPASVEPAAAAATLTDRLDRRGIGHGPVEQLDAAAAGSRELRTLLWLLGAFSALGLALGAFLVANTVAAAVQEELPQIGAVKALGATRGWIVATYLTPALVLGAAGSGVGLTLGVTGGQLLTRYLTGLLGYPLPALSVTGRDAGFALVVGLGVPVLAAAGPVWFAARRPAASLLRSIGLVAAGGRRWDALPRLIGRGWPLAALALRNALRRRLRAGLTVTLIAIAVAAAVAAGALSASLDRTVATLYDRYGADVWVPFDGGADAPLARAVARLPEVAAAESWARGTGYGGGRSLDLWIVPPETAIYRHRVLAGRWLIGGDPRTVVATANLAADLGLRPGDTLPVDIGRDTRDLTVVGIVDDESTELGRGEAGKLFLSPQTLAGFGGRQGFAFLAVALHRHTERDVDAAIAAIEDRFAERQPRPYAAYTDRASTARALAVLTLLLRAMVVLIGAIGLVGIVNTLVLNGSERRRETGVARALGARGVHVVAVVAGEAVVLGLLGYAAGIAVGYPLALVLVHATGAILFGLTFALPVGFLAGALVVVLLASAAAAAGPAWAATRVRPVTVVRYG